MLPADLAGSAFLPGPAVGRRGRLARKRLSEIVRLPCQAAQQSSLLFRKIDSFLEIVRELLQPLHTFFVRQGWHLFRFERHRSARS